jgi:hypothetical protein
MEPPIERLEIDDISKLYLKEIMNCATHIHASDSHENWEFVQSMINSNTCIKYLNTPYHCKLNINFKDLNCLVVASFSNKFFEELDPTLFKNLTILRFRIIYIYDSRIKSYSRFGYQMMKDIHKFFPNLITLDIKTVDEVDDIRPLFPPSKSVLKQLKHLTICSNNHKYKLLPTNLGKLISLKIMGNNQNSILIRMKSFKFLRELKICDSAHFTNTTTIPPYLLEQSLRVLQIFGHNSILEIPQNTGSLHHLKLYVSCNIRMIPGGIGPILKSLYLSGKKMRLKTVPKHMGSLESLILIDGCITSLPNNLGYPNLRTLQIYNKLPQSHDIMDLTIRRFPRKLNSSLKILAFDYNFKSKIIIPKSYSLNLLNLRLFKDMRNLKQSDSVELVNITPSKVLIDIEEF